MRTKERKLHKRETHLLRVGKETDPSTQKEKIKQRQTQANTPEQHHSAFTLRLELVQRQGLGSCQRGQEQRPQFPPCPFCHTDSEGQTAARPRALLVPHCPPGLVVKLPHPSEEGRATFPSLTMHHCWALMRIWL